MELSVVERTMLANQFRIRQRLEDDENFGKFADILERGYEKLYPRIFEWFYEPTDKEIGDEVFDIFDMYRALNNAYRRGLKPPAKAYHPKFDGFDGNNDAHFGIGSFVVDDLGLWAELKDRPRNSHSMSTLKTYREMLKIWIDMGRPFDLTQEQVNQIAIGHE
jgi:uncharacterized protein YfbU (UPF0304 family)